MKKGLLLVFVFIRVLLAYNELSVTAPGEHGSTKPGYIQRATLVLQPHCGFVEQSLYLYYTDERQFPDDYLLEVVHSFNLPPRSVVNDMWLWIGDSVMRARMFGS